MCLRRLATSGIAAAALAGCGGGGGGSAAGDAELTSCASRWNAERASTTGAHAYAEHSSREALVTTLDAQGMEACAVVFSVPDEGDAEYGTVGEVATLRGWTPMQAVVADPRALQSRAAADANAAVSPDGTVALQ